MSALFELVFVFFCIFSSEVLAEVSESLNKGPQNPSEVKTEIPAETTNEIIKTSEKASEKLSSQQNKLIPDKKQKILFLSPELNGLKKSEISLDYEVNEDEIKIGRATLSADTFKVFFGDVNSIDPVLSSISELKGKEILFVSLPNFIQETESIEILTENGMVVWHESFSDVEKKMGRLVKTKISNSIFKSKTDVTVLIKELSASNLALLTTNIKARFKICLMQNEEQNFSTICSPMFRLTSKSNTKNRIVRYIGELGTIKTYIDGKEVVNHNSYMVKSKTDFHFFAASGNQYTVELKVKPKELFLVDFFQDPIKKLITFTGHTTFPIDTSLKILNPDHKMDWLYKLGWLPTIGDLAKYWRLNVPLNDPALYLYGIGGGTFKYSFEFIKIPLENNRVFIDKNSLKSTYAEEVPIYGTAPVGVKISSEHNSAYFTDEKRGRFVWNYEADIKGESLIKNLIMKDDQSEWQATYTIYRGYSSEFSLRTAGVITQDRKITFLGEFAFNHWFESVFGSQDRLWSVQRWGFSFKAFEPFSNMLGQSKNNIGPSAGMLHLKYRFTPGLWERDETWGLLLGREDVTIFNKKGPLFGLGLFWVRSMPKVFDDIFNLFLFMNYPKLVDCDFVYYATSLDKNIQIDGNYALNFHGKVLWSKSVFGEAGFGIKSYGLNDVAARAIAKMSLIYGTVGIGLNF